MVYGAIDLHLRYSHIRILDATGRVLREQQVVTTAERLVAAFTPGRLLWASDYSPCLGWISFLQTLGVLDGMRFLDDDGRRLICGENLRGLLT